MGLNSFHESKQARWAASGSRPVAWATAASASATAQPGAAKAESEAKPVCQRRRSSSRTGSGAKESGRSKKRRSSVGGRPVT